MKFSFPSNKQKYEGQERYNLVCMHMENAGRNREILLKGSSTKDICRTYTGLRAMYFQEFSKSAITGNNRVLITVLTAQSGIAGPYSREP